MAKSCTEGMLIDFTTRMMKKEQIAEIYTSFYWLTVYKVL